MMTARTTPNLYSVDKGDEREELRALAINQLAGVLADLNLVRPVTSSELKRLARNETRTRVGNLAVLREQHARAKTTFERQALKILRPSCALDPFAQEASATSNTKACVKRPMAVVAMPSTFAVLRLIASMLGTHVRSESTNTATDRSSVSRANLPDYQSAYGREVPTSGCEHVP
jgi:hypothetical protein